MSQEPTKTVGVLACGHRVLQINCPPCWQEFTRLREAESLAKVEARTKPQDDATVLASYGIRGRLLDMTFDSYKPENPQAEKALKICREFAEKPKGNLVLLGTMGTGKTHLAVAICRQAKGSYARMLPMIRQIRDSYRGEGESEQTRINSWASRLLLVLDEIGVQAGTDSERMLAFEILDDRYIMRRPTVIVSNGTREDLEKFLGTRVVDRLAENGNLVVMSWESYRRKS